MKAGFIGLGTQGKPLAINLAKAGHELMVYDVRAEPLKELAAAGAKVALSCRDVGGHADIVEICVLDDAQVEAVMLGETGVLAGAARGTIVAIHSTIEPATIARMAQAAEPYGVEIMDAPVSGGENGAKAKTMAYMVGGSAQGLARCRPLFETSGTKITHAGALGTGIRAKLAHQLIICVNIMAAYEGMRLGTEAGVTPEILEKIVSEGVAQSRIAERWSKVAMGPHSRGVFYKDLQLCLKLAHELGISAPAAALAQQLLATIVR